MSKKFNLYIGKSGQLAVMSEFLARGWNVATPEVDIGDDIFVVEDKKGIFQRIQVKSAIAKERTEGYSVQFNLPYEQLRLPTIPEIYYVFMIRYQDKWSDILIIDRETLYQFHRNQNPNFSFGEKITLYLSFKDKKVSCLKADFTPFISNFEDFPIISH